MIDSNPSDSIILFAAGMIPFAGLQHWLQLDAFGVAIFAYIWGGVVSWALRDKIKVCK